MAIAKDTRLEFVLARDKTVAAQIELQTSTNLNTTISGVFAIMGNRTTIRCHCICFALLECKCIAQQRINLNAFRNIQQILNVET